MQGTINSKVILKNILLDTGSLAGDFISEDVYLKHVQHLGESIACVKHIHMANGTHGTSVKITRCINITIQVNEYKPIPLLVYIFKMDQDLIIGRKTLIGRFFEDFIRILHTWRQEHIQDLDKTCNNTEFLPEISHVPHHILKDTEGISLTLINSECTLDQSTPVSPRCILTQSTPMFQKVH